MDFLNSDVHFITTLTVAACFVALCRHSNKRNRTVTNDDFDEPKRKRNDVERGEMRKTSARRIFALDNTIFKKMFRMDKQSFLLLHAKVRPMLTASKSSLSARMGKLSSKSNVKSVLHLACTIRWLAGGSSWDICYAFNVAYSTMHSWKYDVIAAINTALRGNIKFPTTEEELQKLADGFGRIARGAGGTIPNVVASVDSVVIHRKAPVATKEKNIGAQYCRKGYFATTMLAFVDASGRFLSTAVVTAASSHDSTLFACSKLGKKILTGSIGEKWSIVGDDAFTCTGNIITPFTKHTLNLRQRNYNYFCSLLRQVVECAFGRWKNKWGILWRPLVIDADNIRSVLQCTCHLHNYCIDQGCAESEFCPPMEDLWWQRTASPKVIASGRAPPPPVAVMQPLYADAATTQSIIGRRVVQRSNRQRAVEAVENSGLVAPDVTGAWTRAAKMKQRVTGLGEVGLQAWRL
jgi:hypothetical protein